LRGKTLNQERGRKLYAWIPCGGLGGVGRGGKGWWDWGDFFPVNFSYYLRRKRDLKKKVQLKVAGVEWGDLRREKKLL